MTKPVQAWFSGSGVVTENSPDAQALARESGFGSLLPDGRVQLSLLESVFLSEKKKAVVLNGKDKEISLDVFLKTCRRLDRMFSERYAVFQDLRSRGFIVKTALKFGGDFRAYDRGSFPGTAHARWIVFVVREGSLFSWQEFSAKNRVAHSTKKRLLIAVVDDERAVSYWESRWLKL